VSPYASTAATLLCLFQPNYVIYESLSATAYVIEIEFITCEGDYFEGY
jgi:hypothetical protein